MIAPLSADSARRPIRELSDEEIKKWGGEFKKIFEAP